MKKALFISAVLSLATAISSVAYADDFDLFGDLTQYEENQTDLLQKSAETETKVQSFTANKSEMMYEYTVDDSLKDYDAYFAVYDSDKKLMAVTKNEPKKTIDGNFIGASYKLMIWDGMKPIFKADSYSNIRLSQGEQYGWLMSVSDGSVRLMTQEGEPCEYVFAPDVLYWKPDETSSQAMSKDGAEAATADIIANDKFSHVWQGTRNTSGYVPGTTERSYSWEPKYSVRLIKYKTDAEGQITKFYCAVNIVNNEEKYYSPDSDYVYGGKNITDPYMSETDIEKVKASDALIVDTVNKAGSTVIGNLLGGYYIPDSLTEFGVPDNLENNDIPSWYKVTENAGKQYKSGLSNDYIMAEMNGVIPSVAIRFSSFNYAEPTEPVNPADLNSAGNYFATLVESVEPVTDDKGNSVYRIKGKTLTYYGEGEIDFVTSKISAMAELVGYNDRQYATGKTIWNGMDSSTLLTDCLHKGDIIIGGPTHILLYSCINDIKEELQTGEYSKIITGSEARNNFYFDKVKAAGVLEKPWIKIGGLTLALKDNMKIPVMEIDAQSGELTISDTLATVSDIKPYSADGQEYDYAFAKLVNTKVYEIIIVRIKNGNENTAELDSDYKHGGRLGEKEQYGWLMGVSDGSVRLMTQEGEPREYAFAQNVLYWKPNETSSQAMTKDMAEAATADIIANDKFPHVWQGIRNTSGYVPGTAERRYSWEPKHSIRLVKYELDEEDKISKLYGAVNIVNNEEKYYSPDSDYIYGGKNITDPYMSEEDIASLRTSDALIVDMNNKMGNGYYGGLLGNYNIADSAFKLTVPIKTDDYENESGYEVDSVVGDMSTAADDYIFADMNGIDAGIVIRFKNLINTANPENMNTVENIPAMVVTDICYEDGGTYEIRGVRNGEEVSVKTNRRSAAAELTNYNGKQYATGGILWDASDSNIGIETCLHRGDIIITDGTHILIYACVEDVLSKVLDGCSAAKNIKGSEARNFFCFDRIKDYDIGAVSWVRLENGSIFAVNPLDTMNIVEIDSSGVSVSQGDLSNTENDDYMFARFSGGGYLRERFIYRIMQN